jgi:hypothetical protein
MSIVPRALLLLGFVLVVGCGGSTPPPAPDDMVGGGGDGGLLAFGAVCTTNAQCASDVCFVGGNRAFCSMHCTAATQATDCPMPPTSGTCNMQGYCKP